MNNNKKKELLSHNSTTRHSKEILSKATNVYQRHTDMIHMCIKG